MGFFSLTREPGERVYNFAGHLIEIYDIINSIRYKQGKVPIEDTILRSKFLAKIGNKSVLKLLREQILGNPQLTFLQDRDFAIRWEETGDSVTRTVSCRQMSTRSRQAVREESEKITAVSLIDKS